MKSFLLLLAFLAVVYSDLYMHNPRGSNDRLNEQNTNRNNANRLFDSQNNAKGGYCAGQGLTSMYYYAGSMLSIEWTSQHACNNPKIECTMVIQYMCGSTTDPAETRIRNGATTDRIDENTVTNTETDGSFTYGQHEPFSYYKYCSTRSRNYGLYTADRETEGNLQPKQNGIQPATRTRQNNNGNRHGFECPEERDYYPYWHPNPWKDIAVLVDDNNMGRCGFYMSNTQNTHRYNYCINSDDPANPAVQPNTEAECREQGFRWTASSEHRLPAPACRKNAWLRDNHLGNSVGGQQPSFNWTIPMEACGWLDQCSCVLRLRYNISSMVEWEWDYTKNNGASPVKEDPRVIVGDVEVQLAIDTTQFGRTFQDRSHTFRIKPKPAGVGKVHNVNVRGKRGNIVQAYPATEYDFVPEMLHAQIGDWIHWQWKGCDNNPNGNAGEGTDSTDRSNVVQLNHIGENWPMEAGKVTDLFFGNALKNYMGGLDQHKDSNFLAGQGCDPVQDNANQQAADNCQKLNAAPDYFDGGLQQVPGVGGTYEYMSTRNNNFTNRGQKAAIIVRSALSAAGIAAVVVGSLVFLGAIPVAALTLVARVFPHSTLAVWLNKV